MNDKKTAVLTGSTGGLGTAIANILAQRGWNLALVNSRRSQEKAGRQIEELRKQYPNQEFRGYRADLMDTADIVKAAEQIAAAHPKIAALYNNAGLLTYNRVMSRQNVEGHFAVNALAPYLFIQKLRKQLKAGSTAEDQSVVVNVSSGTAYTSRKFDVATLTNPEKIGGLTGAYAQSKLAIATMTCLMSEELSAEGILILSASPGPTRSRMVDAGDGIPWLIRFLRPVLFKPADVQAQKVVNGIEAAVAEGKSGLFIAQGRRKPNPSIALDKEIQAELKTLLDSLH